MFEFAQKFSLATLALTGLSGLCFGESILSESLALDGSTLKVLKVDTSSPADLLLIDGGVRNGLRAGLRCSALNAERVRTGEIMIVEATLTKAVALVLGDFNVAEGNLISLDKEYLK